MKEKILIIDDDVQIGNMLEELLKYEGYEILRAYSGTEALMVLDSRNPDLIILDLMLPGLSGEEILPKIKEYPVIVVSAKAQSSDKINLLLGGADDYLTKPFDTGELLARIKVQLRNHTPGKNATVYRYGDLRMDMRTHTVTAAGIEVQLTKTEYAILKLMLKNPGQVIARSVILDRISEDTPDCTDSSLKVHISHLRAKLRAAGGKEYIEAVWGIGFKMAELWNFN